MAEMRWGTYAKMALNDVDITETLDAVVRQMFADELNRKFDAVVRNALTPPPAVRLAGASSEFTFTIPEHLRWIFVRVRPAAPIPACLWRRNLDAWRKRGHAAHRRSS